MSSWHGKHFTNGGISTSKGLLSLLGEKLTRPSGVHCCATVVGRLIPQPHSGTDFRILLNLPSGGLWLPLESPLGILDSASGFVPGVFLAVCDFLVPRPLAAARTALLKALDKPKTRLHTKIDITTLLTFYSV